MQLKTKQAVSTFYQNEKAIHLLPYTEMLSDCFAKQAIIINVKIYYVNPHANYLRTICKLIIKRKAGCQKLTQTSHTQKKRQRQHTPWKTYQYGHLHSKFLAPIPSNRQYIVLCDIHLYRRQSNRNLEGLVMAYFIYDHRTKIPQIDFKAL